MNKEPRPHYALWLGLLGFILGLTFVMLITLVILVELEYEVNLENFAAVHLNPDALILMIDSIPFLAAILFAFIGNRQNNLIRNRYQYARAIHHRDSEIRHLNSVLAKQDEAHQQLDDVIGRGKRDWETTFDAVDDMIIITDVSGKILRCNRATSHAFRTNFENIIGQPVDTLFFGESTNGSARLPANKTEIRFPNLKGWYEISSSATKLEQDRAATIYLIRDVTERKQASLDLSRQKEYYETLVRNSPFAIVTLSLEQRIVASNPAFERIFGYTQQEVIGHEIDQLISPPDLVSESQSLSDSVLSGQVVHKVTRRMRKDGSLVDVEVYGIPVVLWGKQIGLLALYHDVSQLVEPEAAAPPMQLYEDYTTGEDQLMEVEEQLEEIPAEDPLMEVEQQRVEGIADSGDVEEELEQDAIAKLSAKSVTEIEGIGPAYSDRLAAIGITTIDQYLAAAAHRDGRKHVSEETGISSKLILDWANRADLMRVPGIGEEFSDLLEQAGVDSVNELKFRNPQNLYTALIEINQEKNLVRRLPSQADVESWIESAKQLPAMLTY